MNDLDILKLIVVVSLIGVALIGAGFARWHAKRADEEERKAKRFVELQREHYERLARIEGQKTTVAVVSKGRSAYGPTHQSVEIDK